MKIMIHGATNSTNFGDVLFANLFYEYCKQLKVQVDFLQMPKFGISEFCRKEINYTSKLNFIRCLQSDVLIMMSGGYLGENITSFRRTLQRYVRYILPARLFQLLGKPIYVLGVGGGPIENRYLRKAVVRLLNQAKGIQVRDEETKEYFVQYGVKKEIKVTSDTAQVLRNRDIPLFENADEFASFFAGKKILFLHVVMQDAVESACREKIVPAVNKFLKNHPEYGIVVGCDEIYRRHELESYPVVTGIECEKLYYYHYTSSSQLCGLLNLVDTVITMKLHVGIVACTLGKAVISFPIHREKTQRYYRQIGEDARCIHIKELDVDKAHEQINRYFDKPVTLPADIISAAELNLKVLDQILK